ncbi:hypothetical protein MKY20_20560 [Cytobacillus sp. FSL W8-0315]|uniref:hypothetical protein n=1 Tax=Cytobacillus sp. FSL W8-0315 TaxID=2921600 RepID=UPI0030FBBD2C
MDTGDPKGLFSSTGVFYAMLLLDYYNQAYKFTNSFLRFARFMMMLFSGISILGIMDFFTIREIENQFFVSFSDSMRLGSAGIINVHLLFGIMAVKAALFAGLEWVFSIEEEDSANNVKKFPKKKGA